MLVYLNNGRHEDANALLPEILSHKVWSIDPIKLWHLSLRAYNQRKGWLETMESDADFKQYIAGLLIWHRWHRTLLLN